MLGKNYLKISNILIPNPTSFSENYTDLENVGTAESGRDLVSVIRLQKRSWSLTFDCTSRWLDEFKEIGQLKSTTMVFREESITVRVRLTSATLAPHSEYSKNTTGLYTLNMTITEI